MTDEPNEPLQRTIRQDGYMWVSVPPAQLGLEP